MQLFYLAREQLAHLIHYIGCLQQVSQRKSMLLTHVEIPLPQIDLAFDQEQDDDHFMTLDGMVLLPDDGEVMIEEKSTDGAEILRVRHGINRFVDAVICITMEGLAGNESGVSVKLIDDSPMPDQSSLVFSKLPATLIPFQKAFLALQKMEKMLFAGWDNNDNDGVLRKSFTSQKERELAEHLFRCMGEAYGFSNDEIKEAFDEPSDGQTMIIDQDFMKLMAEMEQTMEADFAPKEMAS